MGGKWAGNNIVSLRLHFANMSSRRQVQKNDSLDSRLSDGTTTPSTILYDLNIHNEWSQEAENVVSW